ncbi:hypothetical protein JB92DRAFT_2759409 [Gautieria morchelliformis]|nr:hypothetical protein JB92DRAFT_2759409 [Gautieria morchelliformis]
MTGSPIHLSPLLLNERTKEPYLRLPPPHSNIILTPPRLNDTEATVQILNDRRVFQWLATTPYPYNTDHSKQWIEITSQEAERLLRQLEETAGGFVGGCPVRILREVKENGDQVFLGDCTIGKWGFEDIQDPVEREKLKMENDQRPPGDPETVWGFGADYLAPSHHGQGIMTSAIGTLIEQWIKPRMGAKIIWANVWKGNHGSVRVFEKNGFVLEMTLEDSKARTESRGGGMATVHYLRRRL